MKATIRNVYFHNFFQFIQFFSSLTAYNICAAGDFTKHHVLQSWQGCSNLK